MVSGPSGLETFSQVYTAAVGPATSEGEVTTQVQTVFGPSGLETVSAMLSIGIGSYILSVIGVTPSTVEGGAPTSRVTSPGLAEFTGGATRAKWEKPWWAVGFLMTMMWLMMV